MQEPLARQEAGALPARQQLIFTHPGHARLTDRIPLIMQLAEEMDGMGFLSGDRLREALTL